MIDLHCHILPDVDDGAKDIETSFAMAQQAIIQGITHILCTPHHKNGYYENPKNSVIKAVARLQAEFDRRQLDITLLEGQEIRINGGLLDEIRRNRILFTDLADTYLLIELPAMEVPAYTDQLFFDLRSKGKVPVIVHPERNAQFRKYPNQLISYLEMGCLAQLTAPSIVGSFGKSIQKTAKKMVEHNLVQMVASDAHGVKHRTFHLQEAYDIIENDFGLEKVNCMKQIVKDLVNGDNATYLPYSPVRQKKFGFL